MLSFFGVHSKKSYTYVDLCNVLFSAQQFSNVNNYLIDVLCVLILSDREHHVDEDGRHIQAINYTAEGMHCLFLLFYSNTKIHLYILTSPVM